MLVLTLGALTAASRSAQGQTVRGQLTDSLSRSPLSGAFVTLVDDNGIERARAITNGAGEFTLSAPSAGSYRIRSKRIGSRPYLSGPLVLRVGETASVSAAIGPIPVALAEVVVAGERQCNVAAGPSMAALWEEIKEALAAVAWTSRAPGYWYEVRQFERETFSQTLRRGLDTTWTNSGFYEVPFRSVPAEQLEREGFVVVDEEGWTYHEPDADVLLSEAFLRTHCFETRIGKAGGDTEGLVGLAFQPARGRKLPDITGTLWIDRQSAELRHLEFKYVRLPQGVSAPNAGGRVEFMRVPTGAWMVRDWIIRMPIVEMGQTPTYGSAFPRAVGYRERGGDAVEIKTTAGAPVYRSPAADSIQAPAAAPPPPPTAPAPVVVTSPAPPAAQLPVVGAAEGDPTRPATAKRSRDVLLPDEFAGTSARDAYGIVQQYRSAWLRSRGVLSFSDSTSGRVQVYVNGTRWGEIDRLREIPLVEIVEIRYRSGQEATMRYGTNHAGGVIEVFTR
jgi:hypothetical protein